MRIIIIFFLATLVVQSTSAQRKHWINSNGDVVKKDMATHYYTLTKTATKTFLYQEYDKQTDSLFQEINYPTKDLLTKEGEFKQYFENGTLAVEGAYLNNKKTGSWMFYDRNSLKQTEITYKKGLKQGCFSEFKKGKLSAIFRYKTDTLHSLVQLFDAIGNNLFKEDTLDRAAYSFVDEEAIFSGGEIEFQKFLKKRTNNRNPQQVKVGVTFNIDKKGQVTEIEVLKESIQATIAEYYYKEALKVISKMPKWEPAMKRGRVVKSRHHCEVLFN